MSAGIRTERNSPTAHLPLARLGSKVLGRLAAPKHQRSAVKLALMGPSDYIDWCEHSLTLCLKRLELTCVLRVSAVKCLGAWPPPNTSARLYSSPWSGLLMHSNLYTLNPEFPVSSQYFTCMFCPHMSGVM